MKLFRIGNRVINMELMTDISMDEDEVTINFAAPMADSVGPVMKVGAVHTAGRYLRFRGDDAEQLKRWIERNFQDLS